jgi:hypothetical protein
LEGTVVDSKTPEDKMMAAMNGPADTAKVSASAAKVLKRAALAEAREAKKLAAAKKPIAKVIPMKKLVVKKPASKKTAAPLKKAAANKKVVRKTMKTGKKKV